MGVSRAEVARRAGVSESVVSYVLNPGSRPVAPATRERVLAAIQELDYRPSAIASALRGGRSRTIGLLEPDPRNPFFAEISNRVEELVFDRDYVLMVGSTKGEPEREARYLRAYLNRRVDGLVLIGGYGGRLLDRIRREQIPTVSLDRVPDLASISSVTSDGADGTRQAVQQLIALGHRRIGMIAGPAGLRVADDRIDGWRSGLAGSGLDAAEQASAWLRRAEFTTQAGFDAAVDLLTSTDVTALFVSSDTQALGALQACRQLGRQVPEQVSLISFDGTELSQRTDPPLTVVQQDVERLAGLVVQRLFERLDAPDAPVTRDVVPTRLIVRQSTGPAPQIGRPVSTALQ